MQIWVDADACPLIIKKILFRAAERTKIVIIFVANCYLSLPPSPFLKRIQVGAGFDMADNEIIKQMEVNDLVITQDIPLANAVVEKGGTALNPRGELYTENNVKQRLSQRDFSEQLRDSGIKTKSIPKLSQREIQTFANSLDRILFKNK